MKLEKECSVHGHVKGNDVYIKKYRKKGVLKQTLYCKKCIHKKNEKYYSKKMLNPEYVQKKKDRDKKRWIDKKEEITLRRKQPERLAKRREQYHANPEKTRAYCNRNQKKYRDELHDSYIRKILQDGHKKVKFKDIPQSLVELKRAVMKAKKAISASQVENLKKRISENEVK